VLTTIRLTTSWIAGLIRRRPGRLAVTAIAVAVAVALLASLGVFLAASKATMTRRAIATVGVDLQVEASTGADPAQVRATVAADPTITATEPVEYGSTTGFTHRTATSTQTTGPGQVVGISDSYARTFPDQVRDLIGAGTGVLLYQQTAANLAAGPGDTISIGRADAPPVDVTIAGVVDLPHADSLFQAVGAPAGTGLQAPPDNVLVLPAATWHQIFDQIAESRPDLVRHQVHARVDHRLPGDPAVAYREVSARANHLDVALAGTAKVGNNLAATLAAARADALYAQVLFLFLGAPGAVLAGLLAFAIQRINQTPRRREQALARARGATTAQLLALAGAESGVIALVGTMVGLGAAAAIGASAFGGVTFGATAASTLIVIASAAATAVAIAALAVVLPAWRDARATTVTAARYRLSARPTPRWMRWYLDVAAIVTALVVFWLTARGGYQLVLAPEGVPSISVSYWAFAGPALLWIGSGLLAYRLIAAITAWRPATRRALRPLTGSLAGVIASSLARQRRLVASTAAFVALTVAFAISTATFNATYRQQAAVDAVLTNGGDIAATVSPGSDLGPDTAPIAAIAATPGVRRAEPIQHRFAYVGSDLQDLYGVNPATIKTAGRLQDAYFQGGTADQLLATLAARPDAVLVSAETVHDYQLQPGDLLNLRLQDGRTKQYRTVPFHYVGVAKEFPTAPSDSFLVANATYVAAQTGSDAVGTVLIDTAGHDTGGVADALRRQLGATAAVTDIATSRRLIGSSLTAVDLAGLTRVELGFALVLAAAATGLSLWLGLYERRRTATILTALGASGRQLGGFMWAETIVVAVAGLATGVLAGWALTVMLIKVLTGVFDPPPANLAVPWAYLAAVGAVTVIAAASATALAQRDARRPQLELLRGT
jgi:putative ABC transport system permease protein